MVLRLDFLPSVPSIARLFGAVLMILSVLCAPPGAAADEAGSDDGESKGAYRGCVPPGCGGITPEGPINDGVDRRYWDLEKMLTEGHTEEALGIIREELRSGDLSADERCKLLRYAAYFDTNSKRAIPYSKAYLESCKLMDAEKAKTYLLLGRRHLSTDPPNYSEAEKNLRTYFEIVENPDPDANFDLGHALAMQERYQEAIRPAQKAVELIKEPKEYHYRLLLLCYRELDRHEDERALLGRMTTLFPDQDEYKKRFEELHRKVSASDE